jgi:hypothetical protein
MVVDLEHRGLLLKYEPQRVLAIIPERFAN